MKRKHTKLLFVCLAVLAAILLNLAVALIPAKMSWLDVTEKRFYTVSEETVEYLTHIDEPMTLHLLKVGGGDSQFEYYLERFCQYSDELTLHKTNASESGDLLSRAELSADNITEDTLILESEKRVIALNYSALFYYETENETLNQQGLTQMTISEYQYYVNLFSQNEQGEEILTYLLNDTHLYFAGEAALLSMIEYVSAEIIPTHYVLTGTGEKDLSSTIYAQLALQQGGGYRLLDFSQGDPIPEDAASVLSFAPSKDYSAKQIEALKSYVDGGGLLTVVTGNEQLSFPNLTSLLASYGLSAEATVVKEEVKVLSEEEEEGGEPTFEISEWVDGFINLDHDATAEHELETLAPMIQGGNAILFDKKGDQKAFLTTSENAMLGEDTATKGKKVLAATVENSDGAKLVWFTGADSFAISTAEMTDDSAVYNAYCLYLVRDWTNLVYESELILPEAALHDASSLQMTGGGAIFLIVVGIVAVPLGILTVGIVVRHRRKKA